MSLVPLVFLIPHATGASVRAYMELDTGLTKPAKPYSRNIQQYCYDSRVSCASESDSHNAVLDP